MYKAQLSRFYQSYLASASPVVLKYGSNVLGGENRQKKIEDIAYQLSKTYSQKPILVSSGAVATGKMTRGKEGPMDLIEKQFLSSVGQPQLIADYNHALKEYGFVCAQILLTKSVLENDVQSRNFRNTLDRAYNRDAIANINENDAVAIDELIEDPNKKGFGDNDMLSAMVAHAVGAKALILFTTPQGLLDRATGEKIDIVTDLQEARRHVYNEKTTTGLGGMPSKLNAVEYALSNEIPTIIASGLEDKAFLRMISGEPLGTLFLPDSFRPGLGL